METPFKVSKANLGVRIHPSKSKIVSDSIKRELSSLLFKFNDAFDGVLLAYEVVDVPSKHAMILSGLHPYLFVRLKANLLLFNPKPETFIEGKVVKVSTQSIHVVVLGFAAAIITEEDIREEFKLKMKHGQEVYCSKSHKRHTIKVGTMIRFLVKSFDEEMLYITGSLAHASTGSIRWLSKNLKEASIGDRSHHRRKREELSSGTVDGGMVSSEGHSFKKSKKRRIH